MIPDEMWEETNKTEITTKIAKARAKETDKAQQNMIHKNNAYFLLKQ